MIEQYFQTLTKLIHFIFTRLILPEGRMNGRKGLRFLAVALLAGLSLIYFLMIIAYSIYAIITPVYRSHAVFTCIFYFFTLFMPYCGPFSFFNNIQPMISVFFNIHLLLTAVAAPKVFLNLSFFLELFD